MIRKPSKEERDALNARLADVEPKMRDNEEFFALYNKDTGLLRRECNGKRKPMRTRVMIESLIRIRAEDGKIVPLIPNTAQRMLECTILRMERANKPVRVYVLKARKVGACLDPKTRILTRDLRWVPIEDIRVGDQLVCSDENVPGGRGASRKFREGSVVGKREVLEEAFRITMNSGEIIATGDHRLMVKRVSGQEWRPVKKLRIGDKLRHIVSPWGASDFEDGWFGGMIDGEGHLRSEGRTGIELSVTQNPGPIMDAVAAYLERRGYNYDVAARKNGPGIASKACVFRMDELFRLIGQTRPKKHMDRAWWAGKEFPGKRSGIIGGVIQKIESLGVRRMIDLQTTEKTFVAEGIVSHNSTWIVARGMIRCVLEKNSKVAVLAHTDQTATEVLKMAHVMRDNMPKPKGKGVWQFSLKHQATYHIAFRAPMLGELMIASAQHTGGTEPFRGFTPTYMQMSEASRYPDAQAVCQSALNAVPKIPSTAAFMETTANGDTGDFRDRFWQAWEERDVPLEEKRQSWVAVFVPWFWREGCRWTETVGVGKELPQRIVDEIHATLTDHEKWLLNQKWFKRGRPGMHFREVMVPRRADGTWTKFQLIGVGWQPVDYDQLAWRRWTLRDEFNAEPLDPSTWGRFQEEFPATPQEAFRASGALVFDSAAIYEALEHVKPPYFRGELVDANGNMTVSTKREQFDVTRDLGIAKLLPAR